MMLRNLTVALAMGFIGGAALAEEPAKKAPEMPKPAAEMKNLAAFGGDFTCEGTMNPSPMGPGGKTQGTVSGKSALGGFWQTGRVTSTMAGGGMPPMEGMFHMTYDPGTKNYVMLWVDNMGAWSKSTSTGWEGDKMVFSGDMMMGGQTMMGRDTFTKSADGSLKHGMEMQMDGKWVSMGDEVCRPAKKK
jgi:hypothetical protein